LPNPYADLRQGGSHGDHWYHGTSTPFEGEPRSPRWDYDGAHVENWSTDLGTHYTALHEVAKQIATRRGKSPDSRIAHVRLHMDHPADYENEHDLTDHAIDWARQQGMHHGPHEDPNVGEIDEHGTEDASLANKETWLGHHPQRTEISDGFLAHLKDRGHDGIVYGNNHEGPESHKSAIAFHDTPVTVDHWEHLHHDHPDHGMEQSHERLAGKGKPRHDAPDVARRADEAGQGQPGDVDEGSSGNSVGETLGPLAEHPKVASDLKKLPKNIQQTYHARVDELRRGSPHSSTHPLHGPLRGWNATSLNFQYRMVHRNLGDELHVLSAGNHDESYDQGIRRKSALSDEDRVSVAEQAMERGGHTGRTWHVPAMHYDNPARAEAHRPVHEFVNGVLQENGHPGGIQVHPRHWDLRAPGSGQATTDGMNYIGLAGEHAHDLTLLHEMAHVLTGTGEGEGHGPAFQETAHRLYHQHLGPDAADTFAGLTRPVGRTAVTDMWPPYLTERKDESGDKVPVNVSRSNPRGPVGTEEEAKAAGWVGPYFHGTSKRRARDIRRGGFRQPRMHNWEMSGPGDAEEVDSGHTHRTYFADTHQDALDFARGGHGDDADVVKAYLHPDHVETESGGGFMPSTQVRDVAKAMAIRPSHRRTASEDRLSKRGSFDYSHFTEGGRDIFDAHNNGKNIGYVTTDRKPDHVWLDEVYVHPDARGHGIARQLMQNALDYHQGKEIRLKPEPYGDASGASEEALRRLYRGYGFSDSGPHMVRSARYTAPHERLFGRTYGLDVRLWENDKLKASIRADIMTTFDAFCIRHKFARHERWAKIVFFGSEASTWTSKDLRGNSDFDLSIGLEYNVLREANPQFKPFSDLEIADAFTQLMHAELNNPQKTFPEVEGVFDQTWFANLLGWDIAQIRPYAAYDVVAEEWIVKPPDLPDWSMKSFPEGPGAAEEVRGIIEMAEGILAMPEPYRTQNGSALWEFVHSNRSDAFGSQGEGWFDMRNVVEKALDQKGLMQALFLCHQRAAEDPHSLDAPVGWSNDPRVH
jgi:GNAT superfamily N-acetyltransferase